MTVLADWQIQNRCENGMVKPFNPELVNPASLDVRLGPRIMVEQLFRRRLKVVDIRHTCKRRPYRLWPGQFILAETVETFCLPEDVAAQLKLKSSRAREGINHLFAGFADPGWHGSRMTLELKNARQLWWVPIWHGMKIGQLVFYPMASQPLRSYAETGRYNNDATVQESRG